MRTFLFLTALFVFFGTLANPQFMEAVAENRQDRAQELLDRAAEIDAETAWLRANSDPQALVDRAVHEERAQLNRYRTITSSLALIGWLVLSIAALAPVLYVAYRDLRPLFGALARSQQQRRSAEQIYDRAYRTTTDERIAGWGGAGQPPPAGEDESAHQDDDDDEGGWWRRIL